MFLRRPGGQSQFSVQLAAQLAERDGLREAQGWIADHPNGDCSVEALTRRARMSPRNASSVIHAAVFFRPNASLSPLARDASRASRLHRYERSPARASAPAEAANTE
jgi:transcriptional regulator GlxA family with amidase domain